MVDDDNRAKISDFGSSFVQGCECIAGPPESMSDFLTYEYMSIELWDEEAPATTQSDVWAFGCIALEAGLPLKGHMHLLTLCLVLGPTWNQTAFRSKKPHTTDEAYVDWPVSSDCCPT